MSDREARELERSVWSSDYGAELKLKRERCRSGCCCAHAVEVPRTEWDVPVEKMFRNAGVQVWRGTLGPSNTEQLVVKLNGAFLVILDLNMAALYDTRGLAAVDSSVEQFVRQLREDLRWH